MNVLERWWRIDDSLGSVTSSAVEFAWRRESRWAWVTVQRLPTQSSVQSFRDLKEEGYNRNIQKIFFTIFLRGFVWMDSFIIKINKHQLISASFFVIAGLVRWLAY